ncbi:MAG: HAD-IA family hydrolase [Proteobacteria bacterium]|nr:HAD-IA family hydrolase [Pseudomonadota bacterium]
MTANTRLRLAAFDLDGTLLDSADSIVTDVMACWEACGFPLPEPDDVRRIIGLPWEESVQMLLPRAGEAEFAKIRAYHESMARGERPKPRREETLFPGVLPMLNAVEEAGYLLAIITSRSGHRLSELLEAQNIVNRFISLKTTDNGPGKPNPYLMLQTLSETGVDKRDAVMIGDTTFDILMACNAGTASIGVSWGVHEPDELRDAGAHHVAETMDELLPVMDRLIQG